MFPWRARKLRPVKTSKFWIFRIRLYCKYKVSTFVKLSRASISVIYWDSKWIIFRSSSESSLQLLHRKYLHFSMIFNIFRFNGCFLNQRNCNGLILIFPLFHFLHRPLYLVKTLFITSKADIFSSISYSKFSVDTTSSSFDLLSFVGFFFFVGLCFFFPFLFSLSIFVFFGFWGLPFDVVLALFFCEDLTSYEFCLASIN